MCRNPEFMEQGSILMRWIETMSPKISALVWELHLKRTFDVTETVNISHICKHEKSAAHTQSHIEDFWNILMEIKIMEDFPSQKPIS